jgi:hypothetical protein
MQYGYVTSNFIGQLHLQVRVNNFKKITMSTNLSSTYSNQDIVLHVGEIPKDVEATNGEVHNTKNKDAAKGEVRYTKNKVEPEVEIKTDKKKTLGTLEYYTFFISTTILSGTSQQFLKVKNKYLKNHNFMWSCLM